MNPKPSDRQTYTVKYSAEGSTRRRLVSAAEIKALSPKGAKFMFGRQLDRNGAMNWRILSVTLKDAA